MDLAVDTAALARWMAAEGLGDGAIEDATLLAGGTQNILIRLSFAGREFVLRRPPKHLRANSNSTMLREARVLGALKGTDVPHPALIAACADESVLGCAFYLMEPVDGFNPIGCLPEPHASSREMRRAMGFALVDGIAALGRVDHRASGLEDFGKPNGFLERQVPRWRDQLDSYASLAGWPGSGSLPGVDEVGRWLERNRPDDFVPGIMHGDYHLANVMFRHNSAELAAIVDWELATIGDPLLDLGWILATWPAGDSASPISVTPWDGFPSAEELVHRYAAGSTRDLSAISWYHVMACYKLGILLEGTHARACAGKAPRDVGERLHDRATHLLDRAATLIR